MWRPRQRAKPDCRSPRGETPSGLPVLRHLYWLAGRTVVVILDVPRRELSAFVHLRPPVVVLDHLSISLALGVASLQRTERQSLSDGAQDPSHRYEGYVSPFRVVL